MIRHSAGDWYGIATATGVALLPRTVPGVTVESVWASLNDGRGVGAVIEGLVGAFGTSLGSLPEFAVLAIDGTRTRIAVRGAVQVEVIRAVEPQPVLVSGLGVTTWNERLIEGVVEASISAPGEAAGEPLLPIADGIVHAGFLRIVLAAAASSAAPAGPVLPLLEPEHSPPRAGDGTDGPSSVGTPERADEPVAPEAVEFAMMPIAEPPAPGETDVQVPTAGIPANEYDRLLFGETVLSSVEAAAVREVGPETTSAPPSPPAIVPGGAPPPQSALPPTGGSAPSAALIATVPPHSGATTLLPEPLGDHDGETIMVDQFRQLQAAAGLSRPAAQRTLPTLLLPGSPPVTLDRGAVIGTRPRATRVQADNLPRLIPVHSPSGEISRSHLELRVEGASVLAFDLNSTNGTLLVRAGSEPVRLQPDEPNLLVAGDRLDLGDGVVLQFEDLG